MRDECYSKFVYSYCGYGRNAIGLLLSGEVFQRVVGMCQRRGRGDAVLLC
jgi:hypothetical protein